MNNSMRDLVLWNSGWWGMFFVWVLQEPSAKIAVAVASVVVYFIVRFRWRVE